jgi:hypothetical protein
VCFTEGGNRNKASKESCCSSFFVLSKENEREKEKEQKENTGGRKRGQKHKKLPLFFFSLFLPQR